MLQWKSLLLCARHSGLRDKARWWWTYGLNVDESTKERRKTLKMHKLSFLCNSFIQLRTILQIHEYIYEVLQVLFSCVSILASIVMNMYVNIAQESIYQTEVLLQTF